MYDKYENGECTIDQIGGHVIRFIILTQPLALGHIVATVNPGPLENLGTQPKEKLSKKWEKYKRAPKIVKVHNSKCRQFRDKGGGKSGFSVFLQIQMNKMWA